jgi:predicted MFS family arabinose efflux permease
VPPAVRPQRRAVTAVFAVNGATFASWLPRLPEIRDRLGIELDQLGLVLLGTGLGGLLASAAGGALVDRLGSRRSCIVSGITLSLGLPLVAGVDSAVALGLLLVALGAVDVLTDIGMNVQAAQVQRRASGSVVQRFHGAWSLGALGGAAVAGAAAGARVSLGWQLVVTALVLVTVLALAAPHLSARDDPSEPTPAGGSSRRPLLALLAGVALAMAVVEGAPGEWAAVFNADVHEVRPGTASLGYLAFAAGMVAGRFGGDRATDRLGATQLFRAALLVAAAGILTVTTSPGVAVAVAGFGITGLGVSVLFPALYLRAADTPGVPSGLGLGVMSTGARFGFLVSPLLVGSVAAASSLRISLAGVVGVAVVVALALDLPLARAARRG